MTGKEKLSEVKERKAIIEERLELDDFDGAMMELLNFMDNGYFEWLIECAMAADELSVLFNIACELNHKSIVKILYYRKILEFYADKENYKEFHDLMRGKNVMMILEDGGIKAREAVEGSQ